jgi:AmmeMemoRadiSam system protein B
MNVIDLSPKPRIRENIEVMPVGDGKFLLRDIAGYTDKTIILNEISVIILSMLDGKRTENDIKQTLQTMYNISIPENEIKNFIKILDENGFLDSPNFRAIKESKKMEFKSQQVRKSILSGKSFPSGGKEAEKFFESILQLFPSQEKTEKIFGVISPHIEITNGMKIYGKVWNFIKNSIKEQEVFFVVLGTSHAASPHPFILTDKDFETPFGILKNCKDIVLKLKDTLGNSTFEDEFLHKNEHSVENQAVFIKFLFPQAQIIPILCSYSENNENTFVDLVSKMKDVLFSEMKGKKFVLIAGADFAHVGTRFGDAPCTPYDISLVRLKDIVSLSKFASNSAKGFLDSVMSDGNSRHVCGLAPIFALLKISEGLKTEGGIIGWDIWIDETASAVSFGGAYLSLT